ncbi:MAG: peroxiredoxin [Myxococcota bacterium]
MQTHLAPRCCLPGSDGCDHTIGGPSSHITVVYFYPKDMTPGCTTQAVEFNALLPQFQACNARVYGVSRDSIESHRRFCERHNLAFVLLSDADKKALQAYGAWGEKSMYGKIFMGILRQTFVIDQQGVVLQKWLKVRAKGHAQEVLQAVQQLAAASTAADATDNSYRSGS